MELEGHIRNKEDEKRDRVITFVFDRKRGSWADTLMEITVHEKGTEKSATETLK